MITSFLCQKASKQTSKLKTKQLQNIYDNVILVSESLQKDFETKKRINYRAFMITSFFCQKASKLTSKLETKQLQTISDHVILMSESLETNIKIENETITDHLW